MAERGVTVFMSSHVLTEVERMATRLGIVHEGHLVAELSATQLAALRRRWLDVGARDPAAAAAVLRSAGYQLAGPGEGVAPRSRLTIPERSTRPKRSRDCWSSGERHRRG